MHADANAYVKLKIRCECVFAYISVGSIHLRGCVWAEYCEHGNNFLFYCSNSFATIAVLAAATTVANKQHHFTHEPRQHTIWIQFRSDVFDDIVIAHRNHFQCEWFLAPTKLAVLGKAFFNCILRIWFDCNFCYNKSIIPKQSNGIYCLLCTEEIEYILEMISINSFIE